MTRRDRLERARWRCRRGTKELDVLLERFVQRALDRLDDDEIEKLERRLALPDQDILEWIVSSSTTCSLQELQNIVALVRLNALGRP